MLLSVDEIDAQIAAGKQTETREEAAKRKSARAAAAKQPGTRVYAVTSEDVELAGRIAASGYLYDADLRTMTAEHELLKKARALTHSRSTAVPTENRRADADAPLAGASAAVPAAARPAVPALRAPRRRPFLRCPCRVR